jgi:hypothetical protein
MFQTGSALELCPSERSPQDGRRDIPAALTHMPLDVRSEPSRRSAVFLRMHRLLGFGPAVSPLRDR